MFGAREGEIFAHGANSIVIGNYLTTSGKAMERDLEMLHALGLQIATTVQS